jgi:hypothetical protein
MGRLGKRSRTLSRALTFSARRHENHYGIGQQRQQEGLQEGHLFNQFFSKISAAERAKRFWNQGCNFAAGVQAHGEQQLAIEASPVQRQRRWSACGT